MRSNIKQNTKEGKTWKNIVVPLYPPIRNWLIKPSSNCRILFFVDGSSLWSHISLLDGPRITLGPFNKASVEGEGFPFRSALEPSYRRLKVNPQNIKFKLILLEL